MWLHFGNSINLIYLHLQDGTLKEYKKSEPIPEKNDDPVKIVVVDSLQEMVIDSGKNGINLTIDA